MSRDEPSLSSLRLWRHGVVFGRDDVGGYGSGVCRWCCGTDVRTFLARKVPRFVTHPGLSNSANDSVRFQSQMMLIIFITFVSIITLLTPAPAIQVGVSV